MAHRDSLDFARTSTDIGENVSPVNATNGAIPDRNGLQQGSDVYGVPLANSEIVQSSTSVTAERVLRSELGISTLLTRLKQSIASAREFAAFLKKRSVLEEEHAQGLKKLCRSTHESARRPDTRQGSYAQNNDEIISIHERMADNGIQFSMSLHQMYEDLSTLATNMERGRKQWKQSGLSAEKRVQDSESMMEKAKSKYDVLAEDYDRARTGDKQSGRVFGLKGPKSAAQHEEDLHRKVQAADSDYQSKVQTAQSQRRELLTTTRPQTVKAVRDLISECDAGLTLQLQKFASFNEKLLLGNGLCVSPLKGQNDQGSKARSLRDVAYEVDNDRDFDSYVISFAPRVGPGPNEIKYERHPTLGLSQQAPPTAARSQVAQTQQTLPPIPSIDMQPVQQGPPPAFGPYTTQTPPTSTYPEAVEPQSYDNSIHQRNIPASSATAPPSFAGQPQLDILSHFTPTMYPQSSTPTNHLPNDNSSHDLAPLKPVFGVSLDDLFRRDSTAVPMVVYQCLQAVDLFGLEVEGIYRLSGSASHVSKLRAKFDHDATQVDFRNPENFFHDVNSVAGLLKQFFRDLPDPLLTREHYQGFIEAARIDDDIARRDSLHATINSLPDPNYATLRALTLHLNRVQDHSPANRMNAGNLAICFGPTVMGSNSGPHIADAGWQVRVIDTILQNTYQIFDDDD